MLLQPRDPDSPMKPSFSLDSISELPEKQERLLFLRYPLSSFSLSVLKREQQWAAAAAEKHTQNIIVTSANIPKLLLLLLRLLPTSQRRLSPSSCVFEKSSGRLKTWFHLEKEANSLLHDAI